jgi:TolA-binding protein
MSFLSLLLAVTTLAQDSVATSAPRARKHRRAPVVTVAPMAAIAPMTAIGPMTIAVSDLQAASAALAMAQPQLQAWGMQAPRLMAQAPVAMAAQDLQVAVTAIAPIVAFDFASDDDEWDELEEPDWGQTSAQADVADSAYRAARQALNNNQYQRAAELFGSIRDKYPRSTYVPDTYYWQAFALYRDGSDDALRTAREALKAQKDKYPKASTRRDAEALLRRVQGALAQRGDADAATDVVEEGDVVAPRPPRAETPPRPAREPRPPRAGRSAGCNDDDEDDIRIAALNAVLQMDADRAVPLLKTVLARRDEGSACLRRKAVFLVSQKRSDETSRILLDAVRNDPDKEVREQAVFWLSQVPGDETVAALDSILQDPKTDPEIQEKAIFALSQHRNPRAAAILCTYSGRRDRPAELREKSIFWLGQRRSAENQTCLMNLYKNLENDDLKEKVIFSVSQMGGADNYRWLMDIALNTRENIELRKKALFWAGQGRNVDVADLVRLYDSMNDREMKEQLIFVYSQRREEAALEKLFQIGKNDPDRELRKKAIFWVGQSRSPRAAQYLQELINQ